VVEARIRVNNGSLGEITCLEFSSENSHPVAALSGRGRNGERVRSPDAVSKIRRRTERTN
jgi:hypothetical protein